MAKLKLRIPTLESVPEAQRALYRQMEGGTGFILDHEPDPDGYGIDNLAAMRGKLDERNRDYERVNQRLQGLKKPDGSIFTPDEIQAIVAQSTKDAELISTLKDKTKTDEQKLQEMIANAKRPLEQELAKNKTSVERYRTAAHSAERTAIVNRAIKILNPLPEWEDLMRSNIERQIEIREADDGTLSHVILDGGKPRYSSLMGQNGPMQVEEFAKGPDLRQKFGQCLRGDSKKGADITNNVNSPRTPGQTGADVPLPPGHTQAQFEAAFKKAKEQGGQVSFPEEGSTT